MTKTLRISAIIMVLISLYMLYWGWADKTAINTDMEKIRISVAVVPMFLAYVFHVVSNFYYKKEEEK